MRAFSWTKIRGFLAIFCLSAAACWAQQDALPKFYFATPLDLQSGRDLGVLYGTQSVNDTVTILTGPTFTFWKPSPRGDFTVDYEPQFEMFTHYGHLSSWNNQAGFKWSYKIKPRWTLESSELFFNTRDEDLRFDSGFQLPRGPYEDNAFGLKLAYTVSPATQIKVHYDDVFANFNQDYVVIHPLFFSIFTNTYGISAEHRFNARSKLTGDYSFLMSHSFDKYDQFGSLIGPIPVSQIVTGTYDFNLTPTLLLEGSGGYIRNFVNSYLFSGFVEKRFNKLIVGGGYSRYLSYLGSPVTPGIEAINGAIQGNTLPTDTINDTASLRVKGDLSEHVGLEGNFIASRTAGLAGGNLKGLLAGLRVKYKLADHVSAYVGAQFFEQNANIILPEALSRKRIVAGIEYTFSPTAEEVDRHRSQYGNQNNAPAAPEDVTTQKNQTPK